MAGYLTLGFLTFWIYTVRNFHREVARHLASRLDHFRGSCREKGRPLEEGGGVAGIVARGFTPDPRIRTACSSLYALSLALVASAVVGQFLLAARHVAEEPLFLFTYATLGPAALAFCGSTVSFLYWVCRTMRDHEYGELLLAKHLADGEPIREIAPSAVFTRRWNHNSGVITLFLILSFPLTASPVLATWGMHKLYLAGAELPEVQRGVVLWCSLILACAGIFHYWGTRLLATMFNGHLRIEAANRDLLEGAHPWAGGRAGAVLSGGGGARQPDSRQLFPRRALAAIMMTDMVGYSRQMEADEQGAYRLLQEHNQVVRRHLQASGGHEVKTIGDAFLVRFSSATDALRAALDIQKEFRSLNAQREPAGQIWVRIGIHIGDVLTMDDDIFGNGVNVVSRIEPLAEPGGICISADVHNLVRKSIEVKAVSIGRQKLKNISEVPELFRVIVD